MTVAGMHQTAYDASSASYTRTLRQPWLVACCQVINILMEFPIVYSLSVSHSPDVMHILYCINIHTIQLLQDVLC